MTPIEPKVARVSRRPVCVRCAAGLTTLPDGRVNLIRGDGPTVCRDCVHMAVRLAGVASHDDDVREGGW